MSSCLLISHSTTAHRASSAIWRNLPEQHRLADTSQARDDHGLLGVPAAESGDQQLEVRDLPVATDQCRWAGAGVGGVGVGQRIHSKNSSGLLSGKKAYETLLSRALGRASTPTRWSTAEAPLARTGPAGAVMGQGLGGARTDVGWAIL